MAEITTHIPERELLEAAHRGLQAMLARVTSRLNELSEAPRRGRPPINGRNGTAEVTPAPKVKRKMSAAARKRISEATVRRWALYRKAKKVEAKVAGAGA